MDSTRKKILSNVREAIVSDLEVPFVLDNLLSKGVINKSDVQRIKIESTNEDKARVLLDILEGQKDNWAFDIFTECLRKDYSWLYDCMKFGDDDGKLDQEEQDFQDAIILGDLPRLPSHYIDRTAELQDLRTSLKNLKRSGRIVIHGMTGSGKSCLAAAAVRDKDLLKESFNNKVYWFNLGETKSDEQILKHLHRLNQRLTNQINSNNSIKASNSLASNESIETMRDYLKNKVATPSPFSQALLILDNVCSDKIIPAFDIGCKMIITTQDTNHIDNCQNTTFIPSNQGFTEEETLTLFAKSLGSSVDKMKKISEAKRVSDLCKGQPMLIDLIGTLLKPYKEDLLGTGTRWNHYIDMLTKKKEKKEFSQIFGAIELCMKDLNDNLRAKYEDFVVFVEDVNIMPEVLQILWNQELYGVQDTMHELENKSLIVSYYNQDRGTYIYGIHDLLLAYLKKNLSPKEREKRHNNLINAYRKICFDNFANLPNDNYIFQYIGYHLKQANLIKEFSGVYFDLNFIDAKIKATGIADLIRDFEIYEKYITNDDEKLRDKLQVYKKFIEINGQHLHKFQDTDIIQCGLQQRIDSPIYKEAYAYAKERPNSLYFKLQAPQESHYYMHTIDLQEDFYAACFTKSTNEILVGTRNGNINLWEQTYNQKLCTFEGHKGSITQLQLSTTKDEFLSVAEDGKVKLWRLQFSSNRNSNSFTYNENSQVIPSPRLKQAGHQAFFGNDTIIDRSLTFESEDPKDRFISASFCNEYDQNDSRRIVTGSQNGKVVVWNINDRTKITMETPFGHPATCVAFSWNDEIIITTSDSYISLFNANDASFLSQFSNKVPIKQLLVVPDQEHCLIALNDSTINMWTWSLGYSQGVYVKYPEKIELYKSHDGTSFICGAVTEDGAYLVIASTDHYTRMWNISTGNIVESFHNKNGLVISLDTFYEDNNNSVHILLSGSDDKTVKQLHVFPEIMDHKESKNLDIFDVHWKENSVLVAIANTKNTVQVLNGRNLCKESVLQNSPIKQVTFSTCGTHVAYGLECGNVEEFDIETGMSCPVMAFNSPITYLKYFNTRGRTTVSFMDQLLVGASQNGTLITFYHGRTLCLRRPPLASSPTFQVPMLPIVQSFYISAVQKLLTICKNRSSLLWNLDDGSYRVILGDKNSNITSVALSEDQSLIAFTMEDGWFEVYSLGLDNGNLVAVFSQAKQLGNFTSCAVSSDKKHLALGKDNGNIDIWNLDMKVLFATLPLHKSWVRYLAFSPSPESILISVSEQIAWWDINKVPIEAQNKSRSFRRRSNSLKKNTNMSLNLLNSNGVNMSMWGHKQGPPKKPHLLSAIKVQGLHANSICSSPDYTSFFTVDNNGKFYMMELLSPQ